VIYSCPECGELLEVHHDMEALKERSGSGWSKLFDQRWMTRDWPSADAARRERRLDR
jgi:threonine synthase